MILEVAILNIIEGRQLDFEDAFNRAGIIISSMNGYISHHFYDPFPVVEHYHIV